MLAYLRLICNPYDRVSLMRVINVPQRGFGDKAEEDLLSLWNQEPLLSFQEIIKRGIEKKEFTGAKATALQHFLAAFHGFTPDQKPSTALAAILAHINYFSFLKDMYDAQEALDRIDNLKELKEALLHHEQEKQTTVTTFLDEVALMQSTMKGKEKSIDTLTMMTLHAAKGLEFNTVIIAGLEEGMLPSSRSLIDEQAIEEERRLLYVGITRARERLLLTLSRYRYIYGTMTDSRPSRFIKELPGALAPSFDCSYWTSAQIYSSLTAWLSTCENAPSALKIAGMASNARLAKETPSALSGKWKKNQPVTHETFGVGVISEIELKSNQKTYLTVTFKSGKKKLAAEFVKAV
jgi:DNA helicase-2/ATP-dependent DNA helicase PcrA